ncbi:GNAT family N-acetyltransferase [Mucilaginibacter sp.]|uniref:GNAT family N-acetyltransferase n=1 Tax=Mucilaginibacter sp. TaxID=1882438 RepID=UPI00283B476C|nr:GNAT family N-acetyltransferase [Mucilaginibacter sp.]MDR3695093.1 GNAT family N-acetyltransferase [Mucilaginibacter sp.]
MITIQRVQLSEADTLLSFSKKTFYEFFDHLNEPANMEAYSSVAFTPQRMLAELSNPNSEFYFAMLGDEVVGYLKLNFNDAQTEYLDAKAMEVERIYVSGEHHGKRIGKQLMDFAIDIARNKQFEYVWLGVWEHNDKAMGFYQRYGFEVFSSHAFLLGDDLQTDLLMKKKLC